MSDAIYRLDRLGVRYGRATAIDRVTLDIARGERVAVVGPNGSGKSTLLRVMGGLICPTSGSLVFNGSPLSALPSRERARQIAYVPQDTSVPFEFSIREIVAMGRSPYLGALGFETPADLAAIETAMDRMELGGLADRSILDVSGGERQRAMIARALAQQPAVLLLDEPAANLDLKHQVDLHRALDDLQHTQGLTAVMVSHDLNAVTDCARVIVLSDGTIHAMGTPAEVFTERMIREVFACRALIDRHPQTGRPRLTVDWGRG
ncbi:MAG: ABC transporter ATP-binding protein [Nitrospiria bacterium]